jgi:hypothetical protein
MNTQESKSSEHLLCPSYVAKPGASLFGIVQADGKVDYLPEPIQIDKTFVEETKKGRPAEERFVLQEIVPKVVAINGTDMNVV